MKTCHAITNPIVRGLAAVAIGLLSIRAADAQIYVTNTSSNSIDEYNLDGTLEQSGFITGLDAPTYIAAGGSDIYVFNSGNDTLDEYNASGTQINPAYLPSSALTNVVGLSASDSEFTVWYANGDGIVIQPTNELLTGLVGPAPSGYVSTGNGTAYGAPVLTVLPAHLQFTGIAAEGNNVFTAVNNTSTGVGGIGIFTGEAGTLTAFTSDTLTVNGLTNGPTLLAVSGANLFEYNSGNGTIGQFTTSGQQVAGQLVTLANGTAATGLAATATDLYTLQSNGSILDTSIGSGTSSVLISGLSSPGGFAVADVPEPFTWALLLSGLGALAWWGRRPRRGAGIKVLGGVCAVALSVLSSGVAQAQLSYTFNDGTGNPTNQIAFGVGSPTFTIGNSDGTVSAPIGSIYKSCRCRSARGGENIGNAMVLGSSTLNLSTDSYFQVQIDVLPGYDVSLSGAQFGALSTSTGSQDYSIVVSTDDFASNSTVLGSGTLANNSTWALLSNSFNYDVYGASGSDLTMRIYGYGGTGNAAASVANTFLDDVTINAQAIAYFNQPPPDMPEPSTWVLLLSGLGLLFNRRIRGAIRQGGGRA